MAKVNFSKFKLKMPDEVSINYNEQVITVKKYLPINEKLELIEKTLNNSADENRFFNIGKIELFFTLEVIKYYTNISFTDKQLDDPGKQYDLIKSNGLFEEIVKIIGQEEIDFVYKVLMTTVEAVYQYSNSAIGILDTISQDYSNLNLEASEIQKKLADPNTLTLLKDVMAKLG
jgi:hypothetical protein